ncbi:MAG TPA: chromosome segregation protein SMC [Clostridia bacterium]|nr:chromosome segregation protein SMC [Clostridia bacterium]
MNLKRIEAYGFKSFADRMTLTFNSGVTCIVGPNGCGKSNVSDAIRWVLGEQSSKNLRGKSMQDVIFSGTQSRKAMGYCEVVLVFDNTNRTYAIDVDEITITRKLYRSGESEYFINKDKCRLKDIVDLFRDTGIGKDGYSVVGQGRVDSFLNAKPEDRRSIFEEAAGISKYREKRKEAERKLERSEDYLLRVLDKIEVYEKQIAPLEKQSKDTLRARDLRSRLKNIEVNNFIYLSNHTSEEKAKLSEQLEDANKKIATNVRQRDVIGLKFQANADELRNMETLGVELNQRKVDLSVAISDLNGEKKVLSERYKNMKNDLDTCERDIKEKSAAVLNFSASIESSNSEKQNVMKEFFESKNTENTLKEELEKLNKSVEDQKREIDTANTMLLSSADMLGEINGGIIKLKTEIDNITATSANIKVEKEDKQRELQENAKRLSDISKEVAEVTADRNEKADIKKELDGKYTDRLTFLEDNQDKQAELRDTIAKLKAKLDTLNNFKNQYGGMEDCVRYLVNHSDPNVKNRIHGVLGNMISVAPQYATSVEISLGASISNIVVETREDAAFLIDTLKKSNIKGRVTILPIEAMRPRPLEDRYMEALDEVGCIGIAADLVKYDRKYRRVIENLLGRVVVTEDTYTANRLASKYSNGFRIVTLDGELYANNGSISGGSRDKGGAHMLSMDSDISECKNQLEKLLKSYEIISSEVEEGKKEMRDMESASGVLQNIIQKLEKELGVMEQRKLNYLDSCQKLEDEIAKITAVMKENDKEIAFKKDLYDIEKNKGSDTSTKRTGADELRLALRKELEDRENARNKANKHFTEMQFKVNSLERKLDDIEKSISTNNQTIKRLDTEILETRSRYTILSAEFDRITKEIERMNVDDANNEELTKLQNLINENQERRIKLNNEQEYFRKEEQKYADILGALKAKQGRLEVSIEKIDSELNAITERVKEEYELDYESALEFKDEEFDNTKAAERSKVIKRELASLGEINERAVEDLAVMSTEYIELKKNYEDVTAGKADLEATIKDLTKKMEENFTDSFEKIKVNFAEVFTELFGGGVGKLDLEITKGQSVLDAGIDISAEPPGKKLKNIDLLSGGEKALTAIAIIFAIIKLHPMPFCVLDEVDAPLDETNANRYAKYLRKFSKNTQFIIVTHRKPTMELADDLYGITMQEKGVSKFFEANMTDALKYVSAGG